MLSLHKIEKLPRNQRLRKIEKTFSEAENRLCTAQTGSAASPVFDHSELDFFAGLAGILQKDTLFPAAAREAFKDAAVILKSASTAADAAAKATEKGVTPTQLRRAFNTIRHILVAETGRSPADWDFIGQDGALDPSRRRSFPGMFVYLEDIRSPYNVGAMFRTAESFGAEKIFISPLCADPMHTRSKRSAMGCVEILAWERMDFFGGEQTSASDKNLPNLPIFALETGGIPLEDFPFPQQGILITGSEELGVSPQALAAADASLGRVSIPCYGAKGSLNVSVVFGIVMCFWARKLSKMQGR